MIKYLPNLLTIFRIILVPVFLALAVINPSQTNLVWAWIVFVAAALTDWLDGVIARKYNVISDFGKIWDPLADKFIVLAALAVLTWASPFHLPVWIFVVIALREIVVTILRDVYARRKIIIPADKLGKLKTLLQMAGIVFFLGCLALNWLPGPLLKACLVWGVAVALLTLISGANYLRIKRA